MVDTLLLFAGLAGLFLGGDMLVRGSVRVAQAMGLSPLVIGLTLVGFGTSAPELVTSLQAALTGSPGIAIGNVVGSNIGNILLILGLAALLRPIAVTRASLKRDGGVMMAATLICVGILATGTMGRGMGVLLLGLLAIYLAGVFWLERQTNSTEAGAERQPFPWPALGLTLAGLLVTILGARFAVSGAVGIAGTLGISETVIGLTIIAIGTSAPELVTSIIAVRRGEGDIAFGNIIGSNIFNILGILGVTAIISPLPVPEQIARLDGWVMLASALALMVFAATGLRIARREGAALLAAYGVYLGVLLTLA